MIARDITSAGEVWHVREHGLDEFLRAATEQKPHRKNTDHSVAKRHRGEGEWREEWVGGTLEEVRTLRTWPEGRERLREINLEGAQLPTVEGVKRVRCWSDDGDEFDRDRFDAGHDDCWQTRRRHRSNNGKKIIRITVELAASGTRTADSLIWSGVAAVKLADLLEAAGYRVEIDAVISAGSIGGSRDRTRYNGVDVVRVKDANDPLNIDALLLAVAHPMFFRFTWFAAQLRRPVKVSGGLGCVAETPQELRGDIHISKTFTRVAAESVVRTELKKRNGQ